jgi:hypothetical protein
MNKLKLPLRLSTKNLVIAILFIAIFSMAIRFPADHDTWWHIKTGEYIIQTQTIPTTDPFSHTKNGQLWTYPGWLAQLFWYALYTLGGWPLVSLGLATIVTTAFAFTWKQIQANIFVASLSLILGAIVSSVIWAARPQLLTFLLAAILAFVLDRFKRHNGKLLPWLPLLVLLWANLHGGFAIAFMLIAAYLAGESLNRLTRHQADPVLSWVQLSHLLWVALLSLAVVVINPHTWRLWLYPFQTVGIGALRDFIQEWRSPDFHMPIMWSFAFMLLLTLAALGRTERPVDWTDLALVGLWAIWGFFAARNVALYGLLTAPVLARYADANLGAYLPAGSARATRLQARLNGVLLGLVALAAAGHIYVTLFATQTIPPVEQNLPSQAVTFIQERKPAGPIFNSYNWGGYLIFRLWPDYPVYIDGRTDLYADSFIRRYLNVVNAGEGWAQTLDEDGINLVLIENGATLVRFLSPDTGWRQIYRDDIAVVFARETTQP